MDKLLFDDIMSDAEYVQGFGIGVEQSIKIVIEIRKLELQEKYLESFKKAHVVGNGHPSALESIAMDLKNS